MIVTYQKAPKGGLSVFYTVPAEDLDKPVPIPVNPVSGENTINRIKGLIETEQGKFFQSGSPIKTAPGLIPDEFFQL